VLCLGWACCIAYLTRYLIEWQHVGIVAKVIIYGAGAYISIPNHGLFAEDTIPYDLQIKHQTINILSFPTFVLASIAVAFFIKIKVH
jgi:hypothetical protein